MSRIDFGWCFFENVKELLLFMFLRAWAWAYICSLYSCVRSSVLAYTGMFLSLCVHRNGLTYAGSYLHGWALTCVHETPGRSPALPILLLFNRFTSICNSNTHSCHFCIQLSLYHSFHLHSRIKTPYFLNLSWIMNLMTSLFFAVINTLCWQQKHK
mgnify:CR=1 FL=1